MVKMNLKRLFNLRGIKKPMKFLMEKGITYSRAYHLSRDLFTRYDNHIIEQICYALNCTPNDLFEFEPDKEHLKDEKLELHKLKKSTLPANEIEMLMQTQPIEKVEEMMRKMRDN